MEQLCGSSDCFDIVPPTCINHALDLAQQYFLKRKETTRKRNQSVIPEGSSFVEELLDDIRKIGTYSRTKIGWDSFEKIAQSSTPNLALYSIPEECATRWNATVNMVEAVLLNRDVITKMNEQFGKKSFTVHWNE